MKRPRLDSDAAGALAQIWPRYDRAHLKTGIIHLGVGAFHRAHQAVYTDGVLARDPRWGIVGASLRAPDTRDALRPQHGLYGLSLRDGAGETLRIIGSLRDVVVAPESPAGLVAAMAAPDVRIVSLTVTEKGYCHDPATGRLRDNHPDVQHDLAHPAAPRSAPGFILAALRARRAAGLAPFSVLCCDNLPANGHTVHQVLQDLAALQGGDMARFIADEVACPATMVDRIVPATTDEDRARIAERLGFEDAWPVVSEPFSQWVIEDHFSAGRPDWATEGAEFVRDVAPFELAKLRLLNGAHSSLAYLGYLSGDETVADAMARPAMVRFVAHLMEHEVSPTLTATQGPDLASYRTALQARFANPALRHRTWQIAMDGSQKLPQRLLGTIRDRLAAQAPIPALALGVAAWMAYVTGIDQHGRAIDVRDPLRDDLRARADAAGRDAARLAPALAAVSGIFGEDLPQDSRFMGPVTTALEQILNHGAPAALAWFLACQARS